MIKCHICGRECESDGLCYSSSVGTDHPLCKECNDNLDVICSASPLKSDLDRASAYLNKFTITDNWLRKFIGDRIKEAYDGARTAVGFAANSDPDAKPQSKWVYRMRSVFYVLFGIQCIADLFFSIEIISIMSSISGSGLLAAFTGILTFALTVASSFAFLGIVMVFLEMAEDLRELLNKTK